jgi:hypothetical protein
VPIVLLPLAAVAIAVMFVLFLYAFKQFAQVIAHMIPNWSIPLVGNLRNGVLSLADDAYAWAAATFDGLIRPAVALVTAPFRIVKLLIDNIYNAIASAQLVGSYLVHHLIPNAIHAVIVQAENLYNKAIAYTVAKFAALESLILARITAVEAAVVSYADGLYNRAIAALGVTASALTAEFEHLYNQAIAYVRQVEADVVNYADTLYNRTAAALTTLRSEIEGMVTAATVAAVRSWDATIGKAFANPWDKVRGAVDDLEGIAAGDFADVVADLKAATGIDVGTAAGAIAATAALALPLIKLAKDCTIPNCRNLSGLGNVLSELESLGFDAALIALVAEAAHNPATFADDVTSTLSGVVGDTRSLFGALVGV